MFWHSLCVLTAILHISRFHIYEEWHLKKNWKFCSSDVCLLNPPRPLLNLLTVSHLTTLCSVSLEPPPKTRFLRLPAVALVLSYPWAFHTATHLTFWILLLRIVFCNSETTSFKNIGIQHLSSSFIAHLLQTFFLVFWMNLIISFL